MGLLIDGIVGPILETFGIIKIDSNGEWTRTEKKPKGKCQKKERDDKKSLWKRFREWFLALLSRIKKKTKPTQDKLQNTVSDTVNRLIKANEEAIKENKKMQGGELRKVSKFEGKALASEGYKVWYSDRFPREDEAEEGVLYVVQGKGDPIAYTGPLAGIRQDGYYIWNNGTWDELESTTPKHKPLYYE